jgi:putative ABC transport system permease protein
MKRFLEMIKIAISSITSNKLRSLLTTLGLVIGISAVVTILSIGSGTENEVKNSLSSLGVTNVSISNNRDETIRPADILSLDDMKLLKEAYPDIIAGISPSMSMMGNIKGTNLDETALVLEGSTTDSKLISNLEMTRGSFINESEIGAKRKVIIIDSQKAEELFKNEDPIGKTIRISIGNTTSEFMIKGIYEKVTSSFAFSNSTAYVPYTSLLSERNSSTDIEGFMIQMKNSENIAYDSTRIINYLERLHNNKGMEKYSYSSLDSMLTAVTDTLAQVTMLVSAIAGISLVVGGIGVMNIMLVSVTERTREIGIRKSLGAKKSDILYQFLIEAIVLSLIGGILGIAFGMLFTSIAGALMKLELYVTLESVSFATIFSSIIGIVFGVYPANKASKLNPIEALRYE